MIRFGVILLIAQALGNSVGDQDAMVSTTVAAPLWRSFSPVCSPSTPGSRPDYRYVEGFGYYKFHTRAKTWKEAKMTCFYEGAHLAIIRSATEALVMKQIAQAEIEKGHCATNVSFVGIHDYFNVGDWTTVLGYPMECTGFSEWVSHGPGGSCQSCGGVVGPNVRCGGFNGDALIGLDCTHKYPFFCKLLATH